MSEQEEAPFAKRVRAKIAEREAAGQTPEAAAEICKDFLDFLVESESPGGIIVDEAKAKSSNCKCLEAKPPHFCFVPGIIGTLTGSQALQFCADKPVTELSDGRRQRIQRFREAAAICNQEVAGIPRGERLRPRLQCMSRELKKKGVEI